MVVRERGVFAPRERQVHHVLPAAIHLDVAQVPNPPQHLELVKGGDIRLRLLVLVVVLGPFVPHCRGSVNRRATRGRHIGISLVCIKYLLDQHYLL